ncbi:hypothetical protein RR48_02671 [Papilio machaon]|uniref:Uncharacterized protein n=1 Tax=Papilio machaon TaxID=76193 RepID=A0A0N1IHG3_PAPMA|nr:hypothetical protein RR48_02671 [Papilio machaon]
MAGIDIIKRLKQFYDLLGNMMILSGERLGLMQSLAGLAAVLSRYSVEPAPQTVRHPRVDPTSNIVQSVVGGLPLMFKLRNEAQDRANWRMKTRKADPK